MNRRRECSESETGLEANWKRRTERLKFRSHLTGLPSSSFCTLFQERRKLAKCSAFIYNKRYDDVKCDFSVVKGHHSHKLSKNGLLLLSVSTGMSVTVNALVQRE